MPKVNFDTINFKNDDKLNREESANLITNYLLNQDESRVISVNSAWGTGKTWFAHMWKNKLGDEFKEEIIPIYYNAWENDDYEDALIPLINQIYLQLNDFSEYRKENLNLVVLLKAVSAFYKHSLSMPLKSLSKGTFNLKEIIEGVEESKKTIDDVLLPEFDDQLKIYNDYVYAKEVFTEYFERFINDIDKTIIIIVDELDRCRPTFAIETLERIKHFFGIDNVHFILLQDSEQLSHSVKVLYGDSCDTVGYLRRFVDAEFILPNNNIESYFNILMVQTNSKMFGVNLNNGILEFLTGDSLLNLISNELLITSKIFKLSFRDFDKLFLQLELIMSNTEYSRFEQFNEEYKDFKFWFSYLFVLRFKNKDKYDNLYYSIENHNVSFDKIPFFTEFKMDLNYFSTIKDKDFSDKWNRRNQEVWNNELRIKEFENLISVLQKIVAE